MKRTNKSFGRKNLAHVFIMLLPFLFPTNIIQAQDINNVKKIAITIDDLPLSTNVNYSIGKYREIFLIKKSRHFKQMFLFVGTHHASVTTKLKMSASK